MGLAAASSAARTCRPSPRRRSTTRRRRPTRQAIRELVARDKNHPSVVLWSIANEPESDTPEARAYFEPLFAETRRLDPTRPVGFVNMMLAPPELRRRHRPVRRRDAQPLLRLVRRHRRPRRGRARAGGRAQRAGRRSTSKPIIITEYGADTVAGLHGLPAAPWTEEYQAELLEHVPPRVRPRRRRRGRARLELRRLRHRARRHPRRRQQEGRLHPRPPAQGSVHVLRRRWTRRDIVSLLSAVADTLMPGVVIEDDGTLRAALAPVARAVEARRPGTDFAAWSQAEREALIGDLLADPAAPAAAALGARAAGRRAHALREPGHLAGRSATCPCSPARAGPRGRTPRRAGSRPTTSRRDYDVVVIGAGAGGGVAACVLAEAGLRVLLVERGESLHARGPAARPPAQRARVHRARAPGRSAGGGQPALRRATWRSLPTEAALEQQRDRRSAAARACTARMAWRFCPEDFRMGSTYGGRSWTGRSATTTSRPTTTGSSGSWACAGRTRCAPTTARAERGYPMPPFAPNAAEPVLARGARGARDRHRGGPAADQLGALRRAPGVHPLRHLRRLRLPRRRQERAATTRPSRARSRRGAATCSPAPRRRG